MIRFLRLFLAAPALAILALATPAFAHAVLVASTPGINASIPAGRQTIHLRYNSRIDAGRSRVWLSTADHQRSVLPIANGAPPDEIDTTATLAPGPVTLHWQVLAIDGHITRGDVPFTVSAGKPKAVSLR